MALNKKYGWKPDLPDFRDHVYCAPEPMLTKLPPKYDVREDAGIIFPSTFDQEETNSCTANATANAHLCAQLRGDITLGHLAPVPFVPSRLFIYYNERVLEGDTSSDDGATIRDAFKTIAKDGTCPETMWPFVVTNVLKKPDNKCYLEALKHQALSYNRINRNLLQLKACLASGFPFVFGMSVYESFESEEVARTGVVPMPSIDEQFQGGHAVLACGFDDTTERFTVQNSWGTSWGDKGFFTLPYEYLTTESLSDDFWTVKQVEI